MPYYANYRAGYPQELVDLLVARAGVDKTRRVLDIGCGTGQIAIPRTAARPPGVGNVDWRHGDSTGLARLGAAGARLAVFAASFHWVDPPAVPRVLDCLLETDGVVVVIGDRLPNDEQPALFGQRAENFAGEVRRAVLALHPSGTVTEPLTVEALITRRAWRSAPAPR